MVNLLLQNFAKRFCRVPSAADTGCCALEIGKWQPQYGNQ